MVSKMGAVNMKIGRREFLESMAVGAGGLVMGCNGKPVGDPPPATAPAAAATDPAKATFDPYEMVPGILRRVATLREYSRFLSIF